MSNSEFQKGTGGDAGAIRFGTRLAQSENFLKLFREGMGLVEEAANYLDGDGRKDSRALDRQASLAFATESMRLTTRLMQIASWLLLQRAVNEGELSQDEASGDKRRIKLESLTVPQPGPFWDQMPHALKSLVDRSVRMLERVKKLDRMIHDGDEEPEETGNPVASQMSRLMSEFGGSRE